MYERGRGWCCVFKYMYINFPIKILKQIDSICLCVFAYGWRKLPDSFSSRAIHHRHYDDAFVTKWSWSELHSVHIFCFYTYPEWLTDTHPFTYMFSLRKEKLFFVLIFRTQWLKFIIVMYSLFSFQRMNKKKCREFLYAKFEMFNKRALLCIEWSCYAADVVWYSFLVFSMINYKFADDRMAMTLLFHFSCVVAQRQQQ